MTREFNDIKKSPCALGDLTECEGIACRSENKAPELVEAGTRLCSTCAVRLVGELSRLPGLYDLCGEPFNTAAAEARSLILGMLRSWAALVVKQRTAPSPRDTVADMVRFLIRHTAWLSGHEAAGDLSEEVARAVRRARHVTDPPGRRMPAGPCVEAGCEGVLTVTVRSARAGSPVRVECGAVPAHRWSAQEWLALGRGTPPDAQERDRPARWLQPRDVALLWGIPSGSVYRHASERQWRRRTGKGRTVYHEDDVLRTLGARATRRS
jgi:hypothetical protein